MEPQAAAAGTTTTTTTTSTGCVNVGSLTSTLPVIPYQKLTDLYYLSRGGFGTVFKAQHSDWRTTVAIKCLKLDSPFGERERKCLLKEAEVLHRARFNHIIQILGICNEPQFFCIVTEFVSDGSLDRLLHEKDVYPVLAWPLRLRVLYEIALGVNFLHNMTPPLLHHDLKTQNILLDSELHVKIADFGLSKWRQLSVGKGSAGPKSSEMAGTVIYMPPEEYEPSDGGRADVKHDVYSYAIITWEVLSRQIPYHEVSNPMKIMFNVLGGMRPDTGPASLSHQIPARDTLVCLMTCGWSADPNQRPSFLECLLQLEPMVRKYTQIDFLLAVLQVKKSRATETSGRSQKSGEEAEDGRQEGHISLPGAPASGNVAPSRDGASLSFARLAAPDLPCSLKDPASLPASEVRAPPASPEDVPASGVHVPPPPPQTLTLDGSWTKAQEAATWPPPPRSRSGPAGEWMSTRREEIVAQMTEACLNQSLDALLARSLLMREDYELVVNRATRAAKVRQLLDDCHRQGEDFCRVVVAKLRRNKQMGLQPFPEETAPSLAPNS
ncbi:receptor-interacting serine/threonine-protein kinase 2 [Stigmatopora nigra]